MGIKKMLLLCIVAGLSLISTTYAAVGDIKFNLNSNITVVNEIFIIPVNRPFLMVTSNAVGNIGVIRAAQLTQAQIPSGTQLIIGFQVKQYPTINWECPTSQLLTYSTSKESLATISMTGLDVNCRFS